MDNHEMIVEGRAITFNSPTEIFEYDGVTYYEVISERALDKTDMSDVIFKYNHLDSIPVLARTRGGSLQLIKDEKGLLVRAKLFDTSVARDLYTLIKEGAIDKMSFAFVIAANGEEYDTKTRTRTITNIKRLYDVSAVDIPAYDDTSISARSFFELEREKERTLEREFLRKQLLLKTYF